MKFRLPYVYKDTGIKGGRMTTVRNLAFVEADIPTVTFAEAPVAATWWTQKSPNRPKWECRVHDDTFYVKAPGRLPVEAFRPERPATVGLGTACHYTDMLGMQRDEPETTDLLLAMQGHARFDPAFGTQVDELAHTDRPEMEKTAHDLAASMMVTEDGYIWTATDEPKLTVFFDETSATAQICVETTFDALALSSRYRHRAETPETLSKVLFNLGDLESAERFVRDHGLSIDFVRGVPRGFEVTRLAVADPELFIFGRIRVPACDVAASPFP